jgi:IS30 family transposase
MGGVHLTVGQKQMVRRLKAKGLKMAEIARQLNCSFGTVVVTLKGNQLRPGIAGDWTPRPGRLSIEEREDILIGLRAGDSMSALARRLGRATSTITREVAANGGPEHYGAWRAQCRAKELTRRPKAAKLSHPLLIAEVSLGLEEWWSPKQISRRLRIAFPDDPMMQVSHETIYQSLFVQGRGELRRELTRCLRSGRAQRRPQTKVDKRGKITGMVMISQRPAEAADRAVPGHWEGDLIIGKNQGSAVGTLVERSTRFVMLLHLPENHGAEAVETAMRRAITTLPELLCKSITWDQGAEMYGHARFTLATGIPIYFCDPHSPWQRGSNENTNGLVRQFMPKGTDLSVHSQEDLDRFARSLNNRPRETLGFMKPSEKFAELLALTP